MVIIGAGEACAPPQAGILRITSDPYTVWRGTGLSSRASSVLVNCGYRLPADALAAGPAAVMARLREYRCQKWRPNCGVVTLREIREWFGRPSDQLKAAEDELLERVTDDRLITELRRRGYRISDTRVPRRQRPSPMRRADRSLVLWGEPDRADLGLPSTDGTSDSFRTEPIPRAIASGGYG